MPLFAKSAADYTLSQREEVAIASMFNEIAPKYDFLNHLFSFGIDKCWRKKVVREIMKHGPYEILDIATGTGDLAFALHQSVHAKVTGVDIAEGMLEIAREKQWTLGKQPRYREEQSHEEPLHFMQASAEALLFPDQSFDAVTVAFGVRNFEHLQKGLSEMYRVLRTKGILVVLEFTTPVYFPVKQLYHFYFHRVMPVVGRLFSKHRSAYSYLPTSVEKFPQRNEFIDQLQQAGFCKAHYRSLSCGIAAMYVAEKYKHVEFL